MREEREKEKEEGVRLCVFLSYSLLFLSPSLLYPPSISPFPLPSTSPPPPFLPSLLPPSPLTWSSEVCSSSGPNSSLLMLAPPRATWDCFCSGEITGTECHLTMGHVGMKGVGCLQILSLFSLVLFCSSPIFVSVVAGLRPACHGSPHPSAPAMRG